MKTETNSEKASPSAAATAGTATGMAEKQIQFFVRRIAPGIDSN